jgi:Ca2+-binding RTX toxin-like protein
VLFLRAPDDTLNSIRVKNGVVETKADGLIREFELSDRDVMQLSETLGFDVTGDGELDTVSVFEYDGRLVYVGGDGDGLLEGEDKDDVLIGGGGADVMIGAEGRDDFIFYPGDSPTLLQPVTGFKAGQKFDLSGGYDEIVDYDSTEKIVLKGLNAMDLGSLSNATALGNDQFAVVYGSFDLSTEQFTALPQKDASAALVIYDGAAGTEISATAILVFPYEGGVVYGAMPTVAVIPA